MSRGLRSVLVFLLCLPGAAANAGEDWTGFYLGGALSFSTAKSTIQGNRYTYNQNQAVNLVRHGFSGVGGSGYTGWNMRRGNWVYGGELALGRDDAKSRQVFNSDNDIDEVAINWSGALVGRVGFVSGETLVYVKGGLAFAEFHNLGGDVNGGVLNLSDAHMRKKVVFGPAFALGLERYISERWVARAEYSYADFNGYLQANQDGAPGSQVYEIENGPVQKLTFGLAYHF